MTHENGLFFNLFFYFFGKPPYPYGDDVARTVDHRQALIHEQLPHVFDVPLVGPAQGLPLGAPKDPHGLQGSGQHHGGQGGGEDEAGREGSHCVHQGGAAGDVASHTAVGLAWQSRMFVRSEDTFNLKYRIYISLKQPFSISEGAYSHSKMVSLVF